jgi:hypothetical protein
MSSGFIRLPCGREMAVAHKLALRGCPRFSLGTAASASVDASAPRSSSAIGRPAALLRTSILVGQRKLLARAQDHTCVPCRGPQRGRREGERERGLGEREREGDHGRTVHTTVQVTSRRRMVIMMDGTTTSLLLPARKTERTAVRGYSRAARNAPSLVRPGKDLPQKCSSPAWRSLDVAVLQG